MTKRTLWFGMSELGCDAADAEAPMGKGDSDVLSGMTCVRCSYVVLFGIHSMLHHAQSSFLVLELGLRCVDRHWSCKL